MSNRNRQFQDNEQIHALKDEQLRSHSGGQLKWGIFAALGALAVWATMHVYGAGSLERREAHLDTYLPDAMTLAADLDLGRVSIAADVFETLDDTADRYTSNDEDLALYLAQAEVDGKTDRSIQTYTTGDACNWRENPVVAVETISQKFETEEDANRYLYNEKLQSDVVVKDGILLYQYGFNNIANRIDAHMKNLGSAPLFEQCADQPEYVDFISADKVDGNVLYYTRSVVALDSSMPIEQITQAYEADLIDLMKKWQP